MQKPQGTRRDKRRKREERQGLETKVFFGRAAWCQIRWGVILLRDSTVDSWCLRVGGGLVHRPVPSPEGPLASLLQAQA